MIIMMPKHDIKAHYKSLNIKMYAKMICERDLKMFYASSIRAKLGIVRIWSTFMMGTNWWWIQPFFHKTLPK